MRIWIIIISIGIVFGVTYASLTVVILETEKAQHLIEIVNNSWKQGCEKDDECFLPYVTTINVGDIILFTNQDEYEHNIRVRGDSEYLHFPADVIKPNEYFVYKFLEYGKYDYYCTLHPWMEGVIQVN